MMTIPMGNGKERSTREYVQHLFNENVELENKRRKAAQARIPSDPNTWQQMRENYEAIILEDHDFSEQHDIEYALWQLHYRKIEDLRALFNAAQTSMGSVASQNGKGPGLSVPDRITKIRTQLKTFLSEATGFYHDLMLKIRAKYGLNLEYFSDDSDNQIPMSKGHKSPEVKKGLISCHRCLIYLGDLARYKGLYGEGDSKLREFTAASSYYMQAASLWPSSGNPHHQLAILAGYSNDELVSIYRYFRSLAVDIPFITARDNLIIAFEKNRQNYMQLLGDAKVASLKTSISRTAGKGRAKGATKPSFKDNNYNNIAATAAVKEKTSNNSELLKVFITRFIRLNGILFTRTSLETFAEVLSNVKNDLLQLLSSGTNEELNFGSDGTECRLTIIRLIAIVIFTVQNLNKENENQSYADILQRSVLLQNAFTAAFEFMGCIFERCYQLNDPSTSYLLPGIMVFIEWLACHHDVAVCRELDEKQVSARSFFWTKCIALLNKLLSSGDMLFNEGNFEACFSYTSKYDESETVNGFALPEDFELHGFLPLIPAQIILEFSSKHSFGGAGSNKEKKARVQRIIEAAKALSNVVRIGQVGIYLDMKLKEFVVGDEPQIADDNFLSSPMGSNLEVNTVNDSTVNLVFPKLEVDVEAEDEEEVIVFKPSTVEKHLDEPSAKFTSPEVLASISEGSIINFPRENESLFIGNDRLSVQNTTSASPMRPTVFSHVTSQYLQPAHPSSSKWLEEQEQNMNGLNHMHLEENVTSLKFESEDTYKISEPSVSAHQFVSAFTSPNYSLQIPQAALSSKFESLVSSATDSDSLSVKQFPIMPPGLKKNPVSRPVRHLGPPPGFGSTRSRVVDESLNNMALKHESPSIPQMDNYSWLDGYDLSSSNQNSGLNNSINQVVPTFLSSSNSNGSMGIANFPFPGKQSSALQAQSENQKGWQEQQFSENVKLNSAQQQFQKGILQAVEPTRQYPFQSGNKHSVGPPQQHPGQSIWNSRFFV